MKENGANDFSQKPKVDMETEKLNQRQQALWLVPLEWLLHYGHPE